MGFPIHGADGEKFIEGKLIRGVENVASRDATHKRRMRESILKNEWKNFLVFFIFHSSFKINYIDYGTG